MSKLNFNNVKIQSLRDNENENILNASEIHFTCKYSRYLFKLPRINENIHNYKKEKNSNEEKGMH